MTLNGHNRVLSGPVGSGSAEVSDLLYFHLQTPGQEVDVTGTPGLISNVNLKRSVLGLYCLYLDVV